VAALRSKAQRPVAADDHASVLKVWAKRHRDLSRARNQVACRLHAVLCDLVPGGVAKRHRDLSRARNQVAEHGGVANEITAGHAARILARITPAGPAAEARRDLAAELLADIGHLVPGGARSRRSWPPRSRQPAPASPRSSASAPSSPPP